MRASWCICLVLLWLASQAPAQVLPPPTQEAGAHDEIEATEAGEETQTWITEETGPVGLCSAGRLWVRAEYLFGWTKTYASPPLATTGFTTDARPGALGQASTKVLYGGGVDFDERHGGRFSAGVGLDNEQHLAVEASYFFLGARTNSTVLTSPGSPVLARPFFDALNQREDSSLVAFPGLAQGSLRIDAQNELAGFEANVLANVWRSPHLRVDFLAGFRYLNLDDELHITEVSTIVNPKVAFGGRTLTVSDQFDTTNDFYGGQVGLRGDVQYKRLSLGFVGKVALGTTRQSVDIQGRTTVDGAPLADAGLLALAGNSGRFSRSELGVVPEVGINLGFRITERLSAFVGYTYTYWNSVLRPGEQIDLHLNPNQIPTSSTFGVAGGPARPTFSAHDTDFWAQGINLGLAFRY